MLLEKFKHLHNYMTCFGEEHFIDQIRHFSSSLNPLNLHILLYKLTR